MLNMSRKKHSAKGKLVRDSQRISEEREADEKREMFRLGGSLGFRGDSLAGHGAVTPSPEEVPRCVVVVRQHLLPQSSSRGGSRKLPVGSKWGGVGLRGLRC